MKNDRPLLEATLETSEAIIDALSTDEVLSDIPVLGTAIKICKAIDDIRNRTFATKLARFINTLSSADQSVREKWRGIASRSPEEAQKIGETLFLVLERFSDLDKPSLLAKVFIAFIDGIVSESDMRRLAQAIDSCFIDDLKRLLEAETVPTQSSEPWLRHMVTPGLTQIVGDGTIGGTGRLYFELSPLGQKLRDSYAHVSKLPTNISVNTDLCKRASPLTQAGYVNR